MALEIPQDQSTLAIRGPALDTSPVLTRKKTAPAAVAPPFKAFEAQRKAQMAEQVAKGAGKAADNFTTIALRKQARENRNDVVRISSAYQEKLFELTDELSQLQGFDARLSDVTFKAREKAFSAELTKDANAPVIDALAPVLAGRRFTALGKVKAHQRTEMIAETHTASQLVINESLSAAIASKNPAEMMEAMDNHIDLIDQTDRKQFPGMSDEKLKNWQANQSDRAHGAAMDSLLALPDNAVNRKLVIDYFGANAKNMSALVANSFAPKIAVRETQDTVQETLDVVRGMSITPAQNYIDKTVGLNTKLGRQIMLEWDGAKRREAEYKSHRGLEIAAQFRDQKTMIDGQDMSNAEIFDSGTAIEKMKAIKSFNLNLTPEERKLAAPAMNQLWRSVSTNHKQALELNHAEQEALLLNDPEAFYADDNIEYVKMLGDVGLLDANWVLNFLKDADEHLVWAEGSGKNSTVSIGEMQTSSATIIAHIGTEKSSRLHTPNGDPEKDKYDLSDVDISRVKRLTTKWWRDVAPSIAPANRADYGIKMANFFAQQVNDNPESEIFSADSKVFQGMLANAHIMGDVNFTPQLIKDTLIRIEKAAKKKGVRLTQELVHQTLESMIRGFDVDKEGVETVALRSPHMTPEAQQRYDAARGHYGFAQHWKHREKASILEAEGVPLEPPAFDEVNIPLREGASVLRSVPKAPQFSTFPRVDSTELDDWTLSSSGEISQEEILKSDDPAMIKAFEEDILPKSTKGILPTPLSIYVPVARIYDAVLDSVEINSSVDPEIFLGRDPYQPSGAEALNSLTSLLNKSKELLAENKRQKRILQRGRRQIDEQIVQPFLFGEEGEPLDPDAVYTYKRDNQGNVTMKVKSRGTPVDEKGAPDTLKTLSRWYEEEKSDDLRADGSETAEGSKKRDDDLRADGSKKDESGFLGPLEGRGDMKGTWSSELSIRMEGVIGGKEFPLLVPTLTKAQINILLRGGEPTKAIKDKAIAHARKRVAEGLSPFFDSSKESR